MISTPPSLRTNRRRHSRPRLACPVVVALACSAVVAATTATTCLCIAAPRYHLGCSAWRHHMPAPLPLMAARGAASPSRLRHKPTIGKESGEATAKATASCRKALRPPTAPPLSSALHPLPLHPEAPLARRPISTSSPLCPAYPAYPSSSGVYPPSPLRPSTTLHTSSSASLTPNTSRQGSVLTWSRIPS